MFHLPGVSLDSVMIDVLHALDLGVTQHALGNILWEYLAHPGFIPGRSQADRREHLWGKLKVHYDILKAPTRIQNLTLEMIRQTGKSPKMRTKGAETRSMVPFALECAMDMHSKTPNGHTNTIIQ